MGSEAEKARALLTRAKQRLGLRRLESVEVEHTCRFSYACVLEADEGWVVSFSGNTRPNRAFAEAALCPLGGGRGSGSDKL